MTVFVIRRLLQSLLVMAVMSTLVFAGVFAIGNPIDILISPDATQAEYERAVRSLGLDLPLWEQYWRFLQNLADGELGISFVHHEPAIELILQRMPATLELAAVALLLSITFGIPLGLWAGLKPDGIAGRSIMVGSIFGFSLPNFWQGLMLIMIFAVMLDLMPAGGRGETAVFLGIESSIWTLDGLWHLALPAVNLALFKTSLVIRLTRASVREVIGLDYVKFARAKGLSERRVVFVHVLKNIMIPVTTVIGLELGVMIAFAVVTETVFAWPGMGKLIIDSIFVLDRPVIVAYLTVIVVMFIIINLVVDILYSIFDPRVRLSDVGS
ncbi:MAG: ABC transporter permease [Rhodospirillaceae bacterium]|nr:ABC transporter permease [Rhodospirillaceae bacterium]MCA8931970.1 ABC transporter permease [Rhodospirillaceae bacterium]